MNAQALTSALKGRWHGRYGLAFCPAHGNSRTPALSLADGADGRLLAHCKAGCTFEDVSAQLRSQGLLDDNREWTPDPVEEARREAAKKADRERRIQKARALWKEAHSINGTLAERYLRGRAVKAALPASLRFHPDCWHQSGKRHPAMIAAVKLGDKITAVHRTYLAASARKADVEPNKAMLGPVQGGAVRLSGGPGPLVVAEGIETALSLLDEFTDLQPRVWAALSTSGMAGLILPQEAGDLIVAPDGDAPGRTAANSLSDRATKHGWKIRIMAAPDGRDWNDIAQDGRK